MINAATLLDPVHGCSNEKVEISTNARSAPGICESCGEKAIGDNQDVYYYDIQEDVLNYLGSDSLGNEGNANGGTYEVD